jgi:hypothetical protein
LKWITALDLENWANTYGSRTTLSELVSNLIRASVTEITAIRFPAGDSAQIPGYDGRLISSEGSLFVPEGESVWEFGTEKEYLDKANEDYSKRCANPGPIDSKQNTLVFVTPMRWTRPRKTREKWIQEKRSKGPWKDIRLIDGVALEDWLEQNEAVAARFSREVLHLMPQNGARSTVEYWDEYSWRFNPPLSEDVLLADRQRQADQLLSQLKSGPAANRWQADSAGEVLAFVVAAIRRAEPEVRKFVEARTLVVDTVEAARQLSTKKGMVFLPTPSALGLAGLLARSNLVIVPVGRDNPSHPDSTLLERPTSESLAAAIKTMGFSEDRANGLARNCGRSVTILARRIPSASAPKPEWDGHRRLIPALMAGAWSTHSVEDKKAIAVLAGVNDYSDYEGELLPYLKMEDPPLDREGDVWKVRAPVDAFLYLGTLAGETEFNRLRTVATTVFSELDPSLDLPDEERLYAGIYGKNLKHSNWLRTGLTTTLRIMAVLGLTDPGVPPQQFVEKLISELPGLAADCHLIASLHGELPALMEAAPRPLVAALERMLGGDGKVIVPIFQDKDPFLSRSPHTGLLWALESLAWDPHHLLDATLILARLARLDPGGKLMNRPINSLRDIFLPWFPNTNASLIQRLATLDQLLAREADVGWDLLVRLLPGYHGVASPTAKPRYREAGASESEVLTYGLVGEGHRQIVERTFAAAGDNPERWVVVIGHLAAFEPAQRIRTREILLELVDRLDAEQRNLIWSAIRKLVAHHKAFPAADWAMSDAEVAPLQALSERLSPSDPLSRVKWLFDEYNPGIPMPETPQFDLVDRTRDSAIRDLVAKEGPMVLLSLADTVAHPELLAVTVGSVISTIDDVASLIDGAMSSSNNLATFASVLSARADRSFRALWHSQITSWKSERAWTHEQFANLILNWDDVRQTWEFAASLGPEVEESYWKRKRPWLLDASVADQEFAAEKYVEVGRAIAAIQSLHYAAGSMTAEIIFRVLDSAVGELNALKIEVSSNFVYELEQIFEALRRRPDVPLMEIARREYAYLPLFGYREGKLTLHKVMGEDANFYVGLLCDAFKPSGGEALEPTEEQVRKAKAAFRLLSEFRTVPGVHEGQIDSQPLRSWIDEVRRLAALEDRSEIADEYIGHILAYAPSDPDGSWPHRAVRELVGELGSEHVEIGIEVERFNMRGPHARALYGGGGPERAMADQYREWTRAAVAWPRAAAMLERIAQSWDRHAKEQDERAEHDKMRFE